VGGSRGNFRENFIEERGRGLPIPDFAVVERDWRGWEGAKKFLENFSGEAGGRRLPIPKNRTGRITNPARTEILPERNYEKGTRMNADNTDERMERRNSRLFVLFADFNVRRYNSILTEGFVSGIMSTPREKINDASVGNRTILDLGSPGVRRTSDLSPHPH
jgi:hypothetical protein